MSPVEHTIIIGAGPAGLAVAACLTGRGVPHTLLERSADVGASWRGHYDRLHLHTPKEGSALPGMPFSAEVPRYPSRAQMVAYLERYAGTFGLRPRFGEEVIAVRRVGAPAEGHGRARTWKPGSSRATWDVSTRAGGEYNARCVVIATGYNRVPHVPTWPDQVLFGGPVIHSSAYRNGEPFRGQDVVVVGLGNSGGEIALDLVEHGARPTLAVRGPVNVVPRDILGIPAQRFAIAERRLPPRLVDAVNGAILRLVRGDLSAWGLRPAPVGPATQIAERGRIPLIDIGTVALIKAGRIRVRPGIARFTAEGVVFTDGRAEPADAVILATGYRPRVDAFLEVAADVCDEHGTPRTSGQPTTLPGLYFCGYRVTATGALREISLEAPRLARALADGRR